MSYLLIDLFIYLWASVASAKKPFQLNPCPQIAWVNIMVPDLAHV